MIQDQKLTPVLRRAVDEARPKRAEMWRSGRSIRIIRLGLASLVEMMGEFIHGRDHRETVAALATVSETSKTLPGDLRAAALDRRQQVVLWGFRTEMWEAMALMSQTLPRDLGLRIGFNSLDGN